MPDTIMAAPVALPMQLRRAPILPATVNTETRSVDVVFTTGGPSGGGAGPAGTHPFPSMRSSTSATGRWI